MNKNKLKKEEKRNAILSAASKTFLKNGYLGTSMDMIAHEAEVTKQTVYRYFESKELLFKTTLENQRASSENHFQEELNRTDTHEALTHFAVAFLELHMSEKHLAGIRLLVSEGPEAPEMTRAFFAVGPARTKSALLHFFETRLSTDDPEYAVKMFISTLLSMRMDILVGLRLNPTHEELEEHAKRTVDICIKHFSN